MIRGKQAKLFRKTHRYLGLILGLQFLLWTCSGLYFSWTNIDEIHGDHFRNPDHKAPFHTDLFPLAALATKSGIQQVAIRDIGGTPHYWINNTQLFNARTGAIKTGITEAEALDIAAKNMHPDLLVRDIVRITETDAHHEYRERPLPAYLIRYEHEEGIHAYVSEADGRFQTIRHRNWRLFDFLWMTHTMDYQGRDDINNWLLRLFSLFGLLTVLSGFTLWFISSPRIRKLFRNK
jgi:uncharacterized iron-regulated membrane protein